MWRAIDLVPMGNKVVLAMPSTLFPFANAGELRVSKRDLAQISRAEGFGSFGEPVRRVRKRGKVAEVWLGSAKCIPAARARQGDQVALPAGGANRQVNES